MARFVRFESPTQNARGAHVGIFGLANGLAFDDRLSADDRRWWRSANDWMDRAYPDPGLIDPTLFDRSVHPRVSCWFKSTAVHLLDRVEGYLLLLDRYGIEHVRRESDDPGLVLYEDDVQVVCRPHFGRESEMSG